MIGRKRFVLLSGLALLLGNAFAFTLTAQTTAADDSSRWRQVYVDGHCQVLAPDTGEMQSNPDVCHLEGI
jgi:hypothetical protein